MYLIKITNNYVKILILTLFTLAFYSAIAQDYRADVKTPKGSNVVAWAPPCCRGFAIRGLLEKQLNYQSSWE